MNNNDIKLKTVLEYSHADYDNLSNFIEFYKKVNGALGGKNQALKLELQMQALKEIKNILNIAMVGINSDVGLADAINNVHEMNHTTLLEYALFINDPEIAYWMALIGANSEQCKEVFRHLKLFNDEDEIRERTQERIMKGVEEYRAKLEKKKTPKLKKFLGFLNRYKYTIILALAGVVALIAAPFSGGASGFLYGVGGSALLGAIGAAQASRASRQSNEITLDTNASENAKQVLNTMLDDIKNKMDECQNQLKEIMQMAEINKRINQTPKKERTERIIKRERGRKTPTEVLTMSDDQSEFDSKIENDLSFSAEKIRRQKGLRSKTDLSDGMSVVSKRDTRPSLLLYFNSKKLRKNHSVKESEEQTISNTEKKKKKEKKNQLS